MNRNKITASLYWILLVGMSLFGLNVHAYDAPFAEEPPNIDGIADEAIWNTAAWQNIGHVIIDNTKQGPPDKNDFAGRFKVVWTSARLYLLAEITDDNFSDTHPNPLDNWWNDDTLEIFIDEDRSGGILRGRACRGGVSQE